MRYLHQYLHQSNSAQFECPNRGDFRATTQFHSRVQIYRYSLQAFKQRRVGCDGWRGAAFMLVLRQNMSSSLLGRCTTHPLEVEAFGHDDCGCRRHWSFGKSALQCLSPRCFLDLCRCLSVHFHVYPWLVSARRCSLS